MTKNEDKIIINASVRTQLGKKSKKLRKQGLLPANIYGQGKPSASISLKTNDFQRLLNQHGGELGLVYLEIEQKKEPALVTEISTNPVTGELVHVEFMRVNLKQVVETDVPIELVGEVDVPNTILEVVRDEVRIKALPEDIPESIKADLIGLSEPGQVITLADLIYDKEKITLLVDEKDMNKPVVVLQEVKEEVEPVEAEATETAETDQPTDSESNQDKTPTNEASAKNQE